MRAVLLSVPPEMLEERRRLGIDGRDEMWDGVVHMVAPAGDAQQSVQADLFHVFYTLARRRGLVPRFETGLYREASDYKVPDQLFCRPDQRSDRGADGAELVRCEVLHVGLATIADKLVLTWVGGSAEI